eukprot:TRINITY_DN43743_c0_g1_i1.p2 TRINITY_DN43743_c0_g1~~TRINITY_DN43743_c0_g1_i1.p2  ORF type:complete len:224 (+),score=39.37 TRINITY_DN43743_c0_g1_i1:156-827(+)
MGQATSLDLLVDEGLLPPPAVCEMVFAWTTPWHASMCGMASRALGELVSGMPEVPWRLQVLWLENRHREAVEMVIEDMIAINPGSSPDWLRRRLTFRRDGTLVSWDLRHSNLQYLPHSFCMADCSGDLLLSHNQLSTLPGSIGCLRVGGTLHLGANALETLPKSFGKLQIKGDLLLNDNQLSTLPWSFWDLQIRGDLRLQKNRSPLLQELSDNKRGRKPRRRW